MTLQTLCNRALSRRFLAVNPFASHPVRKLVRVGRPKDKRALSLEEIRRLFAVFHSDVERKKGWAGWKARRLLAAFSIAIYTGLSRKELFTLQVSDIDLERRVIRLTPREPPRHGTEVRGSSAKPVGMPTALVPILESWIDHQARCPAGYPDRSEMPLAHPDVFTQGTLVHGPDEGPAARQTPSDCPTSRNPRFGDTGRCAVGRSRPTWKASGADPPRSSASSALDSRGNRKPLPPGR